MNFVCLRYTLTKVGPGCLEYLRGGRRLDLRAAVQQLRVDSGYERADHFGLVYRRESVLNDSASQLGDQTQRLIFAGPQRSAGFQMKLGARAQVDHLKHSPRTNHIFRREMV